MRQEDKNIMLWGSFIVHIVYGVYWGVKIMGSIVSGETSLVV
jgi:hypothetical protein